VPLLDTGKRSLLHPGYRGLQGEPVGFLEPPGEGELPLERLVAQEHLVEESHLVE